jgi:hypothetical protein
MKCSSSSNETYFCDEPWTGALSVWVNQDVIFCPCFLKMKIGNLADAPLEQVWNSEKLVALRESFKRGVLPEVCRNQLCPVARGEGNHQLR